MQAWVEEYGPVFRMRLLFAHVSYVVASQDFDLYIAWITIPLGLQALCVSDPTLATEILQMPKILDKNRQALVTLDLVRARRNSCKS